MPTLCGLSQSSEEHHTYLLNYIPFVNTTRTFQAIENVNGKVVRYGVIFKKKIFFCFIDGFRGNDYGFEIRWASSTLVSLQAPLLSFD